MALYFACRDPRVPWYAKAFIALLVAYALSPIDLIPDFIHILGYVDELILLPVGVLIALKMIPAELLAEHREDRADQRAGLERERAKSEAAIGRLIDALKAGQAAETLLGALQAEEDRKKDILLQMATLDAQARVVPLDDKRAAARLAALAQELRHHEEQRGPKTRRLLQRALNGRIECHSFDEAGRRGYQFRAIGTYGALMANDIGGPNRIRCPLERTTARNR
jgi:uncharacterized membrane protein YkvA (DUF1232 family)